MVAGVWSRALIEAFDAFFSEIYLLWQCLHKTCSLLLEDVCYYSWKSLESGLCLAGSNSPFVCNFVATSSHAYSWTSALQSSYLFFFFFFLSYSYLFVSCFFINSLIWIFGLRGLFFLSSLILICLLVVSLSIHWFRYLVLTVWPLLDF